MIDEEKEKAKTEMLDSESDSTKGGNHKSSTREWIESLVFSLIFVFFFTKFIAQATQVPTESMKPTILVGDHFFLDKFAFPANYPKFLLNFLPKREIDRGDIVAFKPPQSPEIPFIKRVIALPGETIEVRNKTVYINGKKIEESYKLFDDEDDERKYSYAPRGHYGPLVIPADSYFMMGDNRDNSNDSRYWGPVPGKNIIGKPLFIYWSYDDDPYDPSPKSLFEHAKNYGTKAANFFNKTRWWRTGKFLE